MSKPEEFQAKVLLWLVGGIVGFGLAMMWRGKAEERRNTEKAKLERIAETRRQAEEDELQERATPKGTRERVIHELEKALGNSNRNVYRVRSVKENQGVLTVEIALNDNLTKGLISSSARHDVCDVLKAVQDSGFPFSRLIVVATFSMRDRYGKTSEERVFHGEFSASEIERIHWDSFVKSRVFGLAKQTFIHPAIR